MNEVVRDNEDATPSFAEYCCSRLTIGGSAWNLSRLAKRELRLRCLGARRISVSSVTVGSTHGGILAALIDLTGLYAIRAAGGAVTATADLRVDYHRPAVGETVLAYGTVVKLGRRISTADVRLTNNNQVLLASGRGAYLA